MLSNLSLRKVLLPLIVSLISASGLYYYLQSLPAIEFKTILIEDRPSRRYAELRDLDGMDTRRRSVWTRSWMIWPLSTSMAEQAVSSKRTLKGLGWRLASILFFGDYNGNGFEEIYGFQFENDSLYLSALEYRQGTLLDREYVISGFSDINSSTISARVVHFDSLKNGQLLVHIMGGYGAQPRNLGLYDFESKTWTFTADSLQNFLQYSTFHDLTGDGRNEIIAWGRAPDNNHGGEFFSDQDSYLMVFDEHLGLIDWINAEGIGSIIDFVKMEDKALVIKSDSSANESVVYQYEGLKEFQPLPIELDQKYASNLSYYAGSPVLFSMSNIQQGVYTFDSDFNLYEVNTFRDNVNFHGRHLQSRNREAPFTLLRNWINKDLLYLHDFETEVIPLQDDWPGTPTIGSKGEHLYKNILLLSTQGLNMHFEMNNPWYRRWSWLLSLLIGTISFVIITQATEQASKWKVKRKTSKFVRINTRTGFELIPKTQIVYCKADGKYTQVETADNGTIVSSINLGTLEPLIVSKDITRVGRSLLINKSFLRKVERKKNGKDAPHALFKISEEKDKELPLTKNEVKLLSELLS